MGGLPLPAVESPRVGSFRFERAAGCLYSQRITARADEILHDDEVVCPVKPRHRDRRSTCLLATMCSQFGASVINGLGSLLHSFRKSSCHIQTVSESGFPLAWWVVLVTQPASREAIAMPPRKVVNQLGFCWCPRLSEFHEVGRRGFCLTCLLGRIIGGIGVFRLTRLHTKGMGASGDASC